MLPASSESPEVVLDVAHNPQAATALAQALSARADEIESIELVGLCTDICVVSNALLLKASFPEASIRVNSACCAGVTPEKHRAALETMASCQIEIL